jgi:sugar phosphate isomerase/epimerase
MTFHATTRRQFLVCAGALAALGFAGGRARAASPAPAVCVFSKHLQDLDYPALAAACRDIGVDGVDLTVRPGGHVLPGRVAEDLPRAVAALRDAGISVPMITTRYTEAGEEAGAVFAAAAAQGIRHVRIGGHKYDESRPPLEQLDAVARDLAGLAGQAAEHGLVCGYHNHSGPRYVGAPLWDLLRVFERVGAPNLGSNFDIGHATVEGAYGDWPITTRALLPHIRMVAVKDFAWDGARPAWGPLGKGVVDLPGFFKILHGGGFSGPVSIHVEYRVRNQAAMLEELRAGVVTVREALRSAGYA